MLDIQNNMRTMSFYIHTVQPNAYITRIFCVHYIGKNIFIKFSTLRQNFKSLYVCT